MSIFSSIKNRILGRSDDDIEDIRSHVLGPDMKEDKFNTKNDMAEFQEPTENSFDNTNFREQSRFEEPSLGSSRFKERGPISLGDDYGKDYSREKDYDIAERLGVIEAQLQAIRSQTETINERLKNMEMRLPRRY
ncbi:MAG: hypothetical protein V1900_04290 [Candidatus Aenigmatarchaeota archaeon]